MKRMVSIVEQESPKGRNEDNGKWEGKVIMRKTAERNEEKLNYRRVKDKNSLT